MREDTPPVIPRLTLLLLIPRELRESVLGDLHEGYLRRLRPGSGGPSASRWYWIEAARSVAPMIRWRMRYGPAVRWVAAALVATALMRLLVVGLATAVWRLIPVDLLGEVRYIGRGVSASDPRVTLLAILFVSLSLFVGSASGARLCSLIVRGRTRSILMLGFLWVGPALHALWLAPPGSGALWIRLVMIGACLAGIVVGMPNPGRGTSVGPRGIHPILPGRARGTMSDHGLTWLRTRLFPVEC